MTTATMTRTRLGDSQPFFSTHAACYALGLHDKSAAGRESCRSGSAIGKSCEAQMPLCAHSPESKTMHIVSGETGEGVQFILCNSLKGNAVPEKWENVRTEPTCKNCIKKSQS